MSEQASEQQLNLIAMAGEIAAAYVIRNHIAASELPGLILGLHAALAGLSSRTTAAQQKPEEDSKPTQAQIRKSITDDALISFIDGKPYKTLKRHISKHGLDAYSYRQKYGLPHDYPITAPSYSERRSAYAKARGFGRGGKGRATKVK